jgi:N utilization substance protein B
MATYRRRLTREKVLQVLYAFELSKEPITGIMENIFVDLKPHKEDFAFATRLVHTVLDHQEAIEVYIRKKVAHWEFERIAVIDRMLLRMGIAELLFFSDIPPKVTINESIEVAKNFSTEKSGKFINGVLDAILEDMKANGTLHKAGRGLIEASTPAVANTLKKKSTKTS